MPTRVCVFIDGSNFYHMCKENMGETSVDLAKFVNWLVGDRELVRAYYYNCPQTSHHDQAAREAQQRFFKALDRLPYFEVRLGRLVRRHSDCASCGRSTPRWMEKGVDMRIGVDMLSAAARDIYHTAILVTGDGDLAEAVKAVKELGKHVEVGSFQRGLADELLQAADVPRIFTTGDFATLMLEMNSN